MRNSSVDVEVLDTTLRDGAQTSGVTFTLQDKLSVTKRLDELGVTYIEGGWPGSNPKDINYFKEVKRLKLRQSEVVAFGSTRKGNVSCEKDSNLQALLDSDVKTAVIFGKTWKLHVARVLKISDEENLDCIAESISYLKRNGLEVIFDAEHFFDGYKDDREYALKVLSTAEAAGSKTVVLCDTNGGTLTHEVASIVQSAASVLSKPFGIHTHNDSGVAVANTLVAVVNGARHVQGTINGLGERCGNADLVQVIPGLEIKLGLKALEGRDGEGLKLLSSVSDYVCDVLNMPINPYKPYVGSKAFAHKGGVHVDAMVKENRAYEHMDPSLVGNRRQLLVSELAGRAAVINEALRLGLKLQKQHESVSKTLDQIKELESRGQFLESADASVHMMLYRNLGITTSFFELLHWATIANKENVDRTEGQVIVSSGGEIAYAQATGVGPVHALDLSLRKALVSKFPSLSKTTLTNYKVTVVDSGRGTASMVRVLIEFGNGGKRWATTAASDNILDASAQALTEGYNYSLLLDGMANKSAKHPAS
jgi:2-isopropylmalate synthase